MVNALDYYYYCNRLVNLPHPVSGELIERACLEAAKECERAGYKIAFHLDPLIAEPTWKKDYEELVEHLFSRFNPAWVSLGALRFNANLRSIVQKRFPNTPLTVGEFVSTPDGKKRYFRQLREELYQTVYGTITKYNRQTPTYLCMENGVVWQNSMGRVPSSEQALEKHIVSNANFPHFSPIFR